MESRHSLITAICALSERDPLKKFNAELVAALVELMAEIKAEHYIGPDHPAGIQALALINRAPAKCEPSP